MFNNSDALWERAVKVIPSGTQTLSKGPDQFVRGVSPKYLQRGKGCRVWDVDGRDYIDYPLALGPVLLGYDYPPVTEAVMERVREGAVFTLMHSLEVEVAEMVVDMVPCAEMVRFAKNGADVTSAAVKVARAYSGRDHIAYSGYHGCQDWYAVTTERNKGIPKVLKEFMHPFQWNDISSLQDVFSRNPGKVACVILEVPGIEPEEGFLQRVKDLAHGNGALFVMDEIVTGFRFSLGGAQQYYGVTPDLACFGKGMANGFPISVLAGTKEVMKELEEVFFSMTFSGDTVGLAAARATLTELMKKPVLKHIWDTGRTLQEGLNSTAARLGLPEVVGGQPVRGHFTFRDKEGRSSPELKSLFLQETLKRGVLFGGPVFISYSHSEGDIRKTLEVSGEALQVVKKAYEEGTVEPWLEGQVIGTVFRKRG
jgi:glutamate-1-semialdehyde aminotransferase